ncbi:hypothetical protein [Hoeflea poritis]|uniref:Tail fiber protein n=1 Tax=Hoeflea poritis TaxID=2993659 RepID=A0ABT4VMM1_9HYPH|nr:hypothetical protein [Hoeflea poritis]MDA4845953.1 hypothetical protein [Hoeflea poritis]
MTDVLFANNAASTLAAGIDAAQLTISVQAGDAGEFPQPSGNQWFHVTVEDGSGNIETMKCTDRTTNVLTIVRGQDGTTAKAFTAGAVVEARLTKGALEDMQPNTANVTEAGALMDSEVDANLKTLSLPANTTITPAGAALIDDADAAAQKATLGLNNVDNTTDANKPVSSAQQAALDLKAIVARAVNTGVGLQGGGDLSADRTISAVLASQAEAEAGVLDNVLMTPLRVAQAIAALQNTYPRMAWISFNGTGTPAIIASEGFTSITDIGTGRWDLNFSTAMPNANYAVAGLFDNNSNTQNMYFSNKTVNSVRAEITQSGASYVDISNVTIIVMGAN